MASNGADMEHDNKRQTLGIFFGANRWLAAIIASLAVVFIVNSAFLYVAVATDDGLVDEDYYRKGLFHDRGLEGEKALGWEIGLSFVPGEVAGAASRISVEIRSSGDAVTDASVAVVLKRPASGGYDTPLSLSPEAGAYTGEVGLPLEGLWDIEVTAGKGGQTMVRTFRVRA